MGSNEGVSIKALVEIISEKTKVPFDQLVELVPNRTGQSGKYLLDSSRLTQELDWQQRVDLSAGIDTMIEWEKEHLDFLKKQPTTYQLRG